MEDDAAEQLHTERTLAEHAVCRLTHGGKGVRQDVVERLPRGEPSPKRFRNGTQLPVAHRAVGLCERFDSIHRRNDFFDLSFAVCAEDFICK